VPLSVLVVPDDLAVPAAQVGLVGPAAQVGLVVPAASRTVLHDLVVLVDPVELEVRVDPVVQGALAVLAEVAQAEVAQAHAEQRPVRLEGQVVVLHVAANPREPSVKSLTIWKHPRWAVCAYREEMATVSDFRVAQA